ncbi:hypothetical protein ACFWUW_17490 [Streptomyces sp. NPDC058655]|uniref:hypothetical protein n=1 Tax=Streptomyces sp. NPDC058655 TaxID=3346577 RepID=UPI003647B24D
MLTPKDGGHEGARRAGPAAEARTPDGEPYRRTDEGLVVEVAAGTTRHAVVTVVRVHE